MTALSAARGPAVAPSLTMRSISKRFDGLTVLDQADFEIAPGEIHALLGENGAGKSSLMNVLTGVYAPDAGEITIDGVAHRIGTPRDAMALGIGMVHQHFRLVPRFTVLENILLATGTRRNSRGERHWLQALNATADELGFSVDAQAAVISLSVAEQQRAEICKVLLTGSRVLILDEPTAVLTDHESLNLLAALRKLVSKGRSVVLITHKLREVEGHCDRVTVMRHGRTVARNLSGASVQIETLARHMMGETQTTGVHVRVATIGEARLTARDVCVGRADGTLAVDGVSFELRAGEILGLAGIGGNGQTQLTDALAGMVPLLRGSLVLRGQEITHHSVAARRDLGLRVVPSDRMGKGLIGALSAADNLALPRVHTGAYGRWWLRRHRINADSVRLMQAYNVAGTRADQPVRLLSGGNAQKLLLARELDHDASVLVAHSPTRGLDVRACAFVHDALRRAVAAGMACLLISEDVEEILALCNRILVMSRGRLQGECSSDVSAAHIGALMLGRAIVSDAGSPLV